MIPVQRLFIFRNNYNIFDKYLAGLPPQISLVGISFVTTEHAPIIELSPTRTPFNIVVCAPIKTSFPIDTFPHLAFNLSSIFESLSTGSRE